MNKNTQTISTQSYSAPPSSRYEIYKILGVKPAGISLVGVEVGKWGENIEFCCLYDASERKRFTLKFKECTSIVWDNHGNMSEIDEMEEADAIAIHLGKEDRQEPAIVATEYLEISIVYGKREISRVADLNG